MGYLSVIMYTSKNKSQNETNNTTKTKKSFVVIVGKYMFILNMCIYVSLDACKSITYMFHDVIWVTYNIYH
jgi:hypothetical protein